MYLQNLCVFQQLYILVPVGPMLYVVVSEACDDCCVKGFHLFIGLGVICRYHQMLRFPSVWSLLRRTSIQIAFHYWSAGILVRHIGSPNCRPVPTTLRCELNNFRFNKILCAIVFGTCEPGLVHCFRIEQAPKFCY